MNNISTSLLLISVYKKVLKDKVVSSFNAFTNILNNYSSFESIIEAYSEFISLLYENSSERDLYSYVKQLIYTDENILSRTAATGIEIDETLFKTAEYELSLLDKLLLFDFDSIVKILKGKYEEKKSIINHLPVFYTNNSLPFDLKDVINSYKTKGFGIFSKGNVFKFDDKNGIKLIKNFNAPNFSDLKNYAYQKDVIKQNTKAFLGGKEANNILLYGDRGCGKSSTVKALINEFKDSDLKIVQVTKESIVHLDELFEKTAGQPAKFIIFADDLSFEETDRDFSSIKAALEGSLADLPKNTIIYATTNRLHMVRESFSSREGDEVHLNDTIDESVSLSDRFGIVLTFSLLTKTEFLDIVCQIAKDYSIKPTAAFQKQAEEFIALKGIRTPRSARQFIAHYLAKKG